MNINLNHAEIVIIRPSSNPNPYYNDFDSGVGIYFEKDHEQYRDLRWDNSENAENCIGNFCFSTQKRLTEILSIYEKHVKNADFKILDFDNCKKIHEFLVNNNFFIVCEQNIKNKFNYALVCNQPHRYANNDCFTINNKFTSFQKFIEYIDTLNKEM